MTEEKSFWNIKRIFWKGIARPFILGTLFATGLLYCFVFIDILEPISTNLPYLYRKFIEIYTWIYASDIPICIGSILSVIICISYLYLAQKTIKPPSNKNQAQAEKQKEDVKKTDLQKWLELEEAPLQDDKYDFLGSIPASKRVAKWITAEKPLNTAIIGIYGSGKSTIYNFAKQILQTQEKGKFIFCEIGSWGLDEESAVKHILTCVIDKLKETFIIIPPALSHLPIRYIKTIGKLHLLADILTTIFLEGNKKKTPDLLKDLDNFLARKNKKLVICLEDIERTGTPTIQAEILSLLDKLRNLEYIVLVIATLPPNGNTDQLIRICERQEVIPARLYRDKGNKIVKEFQELCLNLKTDQKDEELIKRETEFSKSKIYKDENLKLPDKTTKHKDKEKEEDFDYLGNLKDMFKSARELRYALKRTYALWTGPLKDKINFYDLLTAVTMETCFPDIWITVRLYRHLTECGLRVDEICEIITNEHRVGSPINQHRILSLLYFSALALPPKLLQEKEYEKYSQYIPLGISPFIHDKDENKDKYWNLFLNEGSVEKTT